MTRFLTAIGNSLRAVLKIFVATALFLIVALVFFQVITRYFTGTATPGLAEISRFLFIWLVFSGSAWLVSRNELVAVDFFSSHLGAVARRWLGVFIDLSTAALMVALLVFSGKLLDVVAIKHAPATGIPYVWVYSALPLFAFLSLIFILERLVITRLGQIPPSNADGN
ncbi:MAG: TRAP transporter small permease [Rhizobiaceae bacterium]|nr:TRAP transporter small permease [Rhizobiaceae bacterium]